MRSTLFHIPPEIAGLPVFGFGLVLVLWAVGSLLLLGWLVRRQGFSRDTFGYVPVLLLLGLVIAYVLPGISDAGGLPIRGYGMMLLVAVSSAVGMAMYRGRRMGVDPDVIMSLALWLFVGGIIGGRLFYVVEYWDRDFSPRAQLAEMVAAGELSAGLPGADAESSATPQPATTEPTSDDWWRAVRASAIRVVRIDTGGLVVYGALIAGGLALIAFVYRHHLPGLALADLIAPSVVLGVGLGRIGCFLNGCCFGGPCDLPWAVTFPAGSAPHEQQVRLGQVYGLLVVADRKGHPIIGDITMNTPAAYIGLAKFEPIHEINRHPVRTLPEAQQEIANAFYKGEPLELITPLGVRRLTPMTGTSEHSRPVHPTQLYSALDAFVLCAFLIAYYPYRHRDGELTALTLTLHPISRFLLEIIRTDEGPVFGTGLSISQNISLLIFAGGVLLWLYLWRRPAGTLYPIARPAMAK